MQVEGAIHQASLDGAYDQRGCCDALAAHGAKQVVIPPRRRARIGRHGNRKGPRHPRDENLRKIRRLGCAEWKRQSGYHRRSRAETTFFRLKAIFGERLAARSFPGQGNEMLIRCAALNKLTTLGMPESYAAIAA